MRYHQLISSVWPQSQSALLDRQTWRHVTGAISHGSAAFAGSAHCERSNIRKYNKQFMKYVRDYSAITRLYCAGKILQKLRMPDRSWQKTRRSVAGYSHQGGIHFSRGILSPTLEQYLRFYRKAIWPFNTTALLKQSKTLPNYLSLTSLLLKLAWISKLLDTQIQTISARIQAIFAE